MGKKTEFGPEHLSRIPRGKIKSPSVGRKIQIGGRILRSRAGRRSNEIRHKPLIEGKTGGLSAKERVSEPPRVREDLTKRDKTSEGEISK